mgnify:CR=1 FL=1
MKSVNRVIWQKIVLKIWSRFNRKSFWRKMSSFKNMFQFLNYDFPILVQSGAKYGQLKSIRRFW